VIPGINWVSCMNHAWELGIMVVIFQYIHNCTYSKLHCKHWVCPDVSDLLQLTLRGKINVLFGAGKCLAVPAARLPGNS
jgi:hypothetical protein